MSTNKKITELTELSEADLSDDDVLPIVDISTGTTNKVRKSTLASALSGVASITATSPIAVDQSTGSVVVSTDTIPITSGGTGAVTAGDALNNLGAAPDPTDTRGDIITRGVSALEKLAIGTNNTVLRSDGTDPSWGSVAATELTGTLPIANGGTNATSASAARTSLGLVIGTDVAAAGANSDITSITGLTTDGSAAAPSLAFSTDANTGLFRPGADQLGFTTGGTSRVVIDSSGATTFSGDVVAPDELSYEVTTANLPASRPTLDFNFAQSNVIDSRIAITRASTAAYYDDKGILQTAAANVGRLDYDPSTLEPRGFLIEGAATNLLTYSEQFDNAAYYNGRASISANTTVAPDGATTADRLIEDSTASASHYGALRDLTLADNTDYTFSVYLKAGTRRYAILQFLPKTGSDRRFWVDLTNGVSGSTFASPVATSLQDVGGGWYRASITVNSASGGTTPQAWIGMSDTDAQISYSGDGSSYFDIWGIQIEAGSAPSSYIATTSSTVTRAADAVTISALNTAPWFVNAAQTWVVEFEGPVDPVSQRIIKLDDGTTNNRFIMAVNAGYDLDVRVYNSGSLVVNTGTILYSSSGVSKAAMTLAPDDLYATANGGAGQSDTSTGGEIGQLTTLNIGSDGPGAELFGWIRSLTYYPQRLTDTQLVALTEV